MWIEVACWLPRIYRPPLGEGQQGERELKPPWSGSKTCRDPAPTFLAVLLSDRFFPTNPTTVKFYDPHLTITKPHRIRPVSSQN